MITKQNYKMETAILESRYARSLIEASLDPLITISLEGKITDMNQATVDITGKSRVEIIGTDFFNYFTEIETAKEVYQEIFAKGNVANLPLTLRGKDGKLTDVLFNGSVYKNEKGEILGQVIVARDVTEQKKIAKELNEAKIFAELATEIALKAKKKAEAATLVAEDAVKTKQQFLSNMSHEIRTPMNAIIGFTNVLLKTELTDRQEEYLQVIKTSGDALIVLINDILDLAKVDAGKTTIEQAPFKLADSVTSMVNLFEPKIQEKNLKLIKEYDTNIPEILIGDSVHLNQIILNILSNAVKFTSKGTIKVSVRLKKETKKTATVEFSISDTGIGIAVNKKKLIFETFQQATSGTSRLYGGTGLGLAIAKQLVEAQGSKINVNSTLGVGSEFNFILEFKKSTAKKELTSEITENCSDTKNIKVLVVEDIPLNQLLMKTLLDDFGFKWEIASNGKIAIEKLKTKTFDIVLMDLQMPEMNGFEATQHIRKKLNLTFPIMALTADVTTVDLEKCKSVGMNDYISKPIDDKLLHSKIVELVQNHDLINKKNSHIYIDLTYLFKLTKSNPDLMMEMITLYLEQTPRLINVINEGYKNKDWDSIRRAAHKMIPSFAIIGISQEVENLAKKIQECAELSQNIHELPGLIIQLEEICKQVYSELEDEYQIIKKTNYAKLK